MIRAAGWLIVPAVVPLIALGVWTPSAQTAEVTLIGTSANVAEPGQPMRIRILRWSTDAERTPLVNALAAPAAPAAPAPAAVGRAEGAAARGPAGRGGGRAGRGARGRGDAPPADPMAAFTASIGRAPTVGYIWTNDVTGYAIKYAQRLSTPDGGERIIVATNRRLGEYSAAWLPQAAALTDYPFTVLEIRFDPKGIGEAKTSLTSKVIVDTDAKTLALDNYAAAPAILEKVTR